MRKSGILETLIKTLIKTVENANKIYTIAKIKKL